MDKERALTWILGVILVAVVIQAIQLNAMAAKVKAQEEQLNALEESTQELSELNLTARGFSGGGGSLALEKLKELPKMVGGC